MPKKKHPHNRAERLSRKQYEHEQRNKGVDQPKVRHKIIEELKQRESEDELKQVARGQNTSPNGT